MLSPDDRFVLAYNGEIYNHLELRRALSAMGFAPSWRGTSDTETLLAAFGAWGIEEALKRAYGMFALALWDRQAKTLYLARDRLGEKPLYYGWSGPNFLFASELKALAAHPEFSPEIDRGALAAYLRHNYVPAPFSIWRGIFKLEPGCVLSLSMGALPLTAPPKPGTAGSGVRLSRYWSLAEVVEAGARDQIHDEEQALEELNKALLAAVTRQQISDVPLGAFLSGGIDSSLIVALMQSQATRPIKTFTVGFESEAYDESLSARAVAAHLGTDHTEVRVTEAEARDVIPLLPRLYDEPFGDSSQIPTHLVARAARRSVTVALSGDAGDELFGGYYRYFLVPAAWERLKRFPFPLRAAMGRVLRSIPLPLLDHLSPMLGTVTPMAQNVKRAGDKLHRLGERLGHVRTIDDMFFSIVSEWPDPGAVVVGTEGPVVEARGCLYDALPSLGMDDPAARMMFRDSLSYLPDDILCKVDRAAMGVSLETRVPFLDPDVVALAWRLPMSMKIRGGEGKWALRQILYRHLPRELMERPKTGFGIPAAEWLRGPLRDWAEDLLSASTMADEGLLHHAPIRSMWEEHLTSRRDWAPSLWGVLMFEAWLREGRKSTSPMAAVEASALTG